MIVQLDPYIPVDTPRGPGFCIAWIDYSEDHDTLWKVIITATREVWDVPQPLVRGVKNITMGRVAEPTPFYGKPVMPGTDARRIFEG